MVKTVLCHEQINDDDELYYVKINMQNVITTRKE